MVLGTFDMPENGYQLILDRDGMNRYLKFEIELDPILHNSFRPERVEVGEHFQELWAR